MLQRVQDKFVEGLFIFQEELPRDGRRGSVVIANQCRIFLEEDLEEVPGKMISPCLCSGSVKYVHFSCMCSWIERNSREPLSNCKKVGVFQCEMCKYKIEFQCERQTKVRDWVQFKQRASTYMLTFLLLSIIICVCLSLTVVGCFLMSNRQVFSPSRDLLVQSVAIVCGVLLMLLLACLAVYKLIAHFLLNVVTRISKIHAPKQESPRKREQSSTVCFLTESSVNHKNLTETKFSNVSIFPLEITNMDSLN